MKQLLSSVTLLLSVLLALPLYAGDAENGKKLHDAKCTGCHDTRQYTRPNRIVHTYEDLRGRVEFCDSAAGANFTGEQLEDVVTYLNTAFYKFKE
jgi:cytochrome c2